MPTRSKFRHEARERILQILRAGGSRRAAAAAGGVDAATLHRWIERGKSGHPEERWALFRQQVLEAEGTPPELVALRDEFDRILGDPALAWTWLQKNDPSFFAPDDPEPVMVEVAFSPKPVIAPAYDRPELEGDPA